jgi:hypothetical protein
MLNVTVNFFAGNVNRLRNDERRLAKHNATQADNHPVSL